MSLLEIILDLHGKNTSERLSEMVERGVPNVLWEYIQMCFTEDGHFTQRGKDAFCHFVADILT